MRSIVIVDSLRRIQSSLSSLTEMLHQEAPRERVVKKKLQRHLFLPESHQPTRLIGLVLCRKRSLSIMDIQTVLESCAKIKCEWPSKRISFRSHFPTFPFLCHYAYGIIDLKRPLRGKQCTRVPTRTP